MSQTVFERLTEAVSSRILIIDGSMGVFLQSYNLPEADFRGDRFRSHHRDLKGNFDILCLTRPDLIEGIHNAYLEAGADIIETNTFSSTSIAQADYDMQSLAYELNVASAQCARKAIEEYYAENPTNQNSKFVAGAIGPLNKTLSLSPDVNNPGYRAVTFDEVVAAYYEQIKGLVDGGVDVLLIETIFDTLNAKGAIFAIKKYFQDTNKPELLEAFYISVMHANPLSVGLNCALGAHEMRPHIEELSHLAKCFVSAYPNAGLPNAMGEYDERPEDTGHYLEEWAKEGWVNIVGGCCGTTPDHIRHIADHVKNITPRKRPITETALV